VVESTMVFLGYRAKRPWRPDPAWDPENKTGVVEVCSASDCLAKPPPGWEQRWDFNRAGCYTTAAEALATVPVDERAQYVTFAYWFVAATGRPADPFDSSFPPLPAGSGPSDFEVLGYDVVEVSVVSSVPPRLPGFGHSPLSCNLLAREVPVNRYCLVDDRDDALRLAELFNVEQPEPGTYFAVLVARASST
jgi:hypothetical protein